MAYLLDTNSWIHYLKLADSPIRVRLQIIVHGTNSGRREMVDFYRF